MGEVFGKRFNAVLAQVVLICLFCAGGTAALCHEIRRRVGKDLHQRILACGLDGALHHVDLIVIGVIVIRIGVLGFVKVQPTRYFGICTGDMLVRGIVASADVVAHDIQAQAFRPEYCVCGMLGQRIGIPQPVGPPAQAGAPAFKHAAVGGDGLLGRYGDFHIGLRGCGEGRRSRQTEGKRQRGDAPEEAVCHKNHLSLNEEEGRDEEC